jgi:Sec-independent protein translocase protein TatA
VNFSISEIIVILLIALLVIKPEQLPDVAHTLGRFFQSVRQMISKVKNEMNGFIDSVENPAEKKREQQ